MTPPLRRAAHASVVLLLAAAPLAAQAPRTERVRFATGASSAVIEGRIKGDETVDYLVNAKQGQSANVSLATKHGATYFNILAPGKTDEAFFIGSTSDNQYEGTLPATGDYRIRVYMMRSAARRKETASYRLEVIIQGAGAAAAGGTDAKVKGTDFEATGSIPCSMGGGRPTGTCAYGVKRRGGGSGSVVVTKPDGGTRTILYERGEATGYEASPTDTGKFGKSRQADLTIVTIGAERYEIPDAVITGG